MRNPRRDRTGRILTIGRPTRARAVAGAGVLLGGALVLYATTLSGFPLHRNVLVLGVVVTLTWLVDGSSRRYLGTGLAAIAVGLGSTLVADGGVQVAEQAVVYPLIGASLLAVWLINPSEVKGAGAFLIIVGAVVWSFEAGLDYNGGYGLAVVIAGWGAVRLVASLRIPRDTPASGTQSNTASTTTLSS